MSANRENICPEFRESSVRLAKESKNHTAQTARELGLNDYLLPVEYETLKMLNKAA